MATIAWANQVLQGQDLESGERSLLEREIRAYLAEGDSFLQELYEVNMENIVSALMVAKARLSGAKFNGMLAGDAEIGMQRIRAGHILRDTTTAETPINTWVSSSIASGAFTSSTDYFLGYSTNNTTALHIDKEACVLILGAEFTQGVSPTVEELYITVGSTTYPVIVLRDAWSADNRNRRKATKIVPILCEPKATVLGQVLSIAASSVQELRLLGITFAYGRFLRQQTYSSVST